jgi:O-antigen ligase
MSLSVSLQRFVGGRWFALFEFVIVILSGIFWYIFPGTIWPLLPALVPMGLRLVSGKYLYPCTLLDILILVFLITAGMAYWVAYNNVEALNKFWLIVASVLLYYTLRVQPKENWVLLAGFWFCIGVGLSSYFLLTHNFETQPAKFVFINKIGLALMYFHLDTELPYVHPNDISGIAIIMSSFGIYLYWMFNEIMISRPVSLLILIGYGIVSFAILLGTSRGAWIALACSMGVWLVYKFLDKYGSARNVIGAYLFPGLVVGSLLAGSIMLLFLPLGSFEIGSYSSQYGMGGRIELIRQALLIINDFPITGGGLGSFPGLYSQYVLSIPNYFILNSHNMFVDVAVEQGVIGGFVFASIYGISIWQICSLIKQKQPRGSYIMNLAVLISLVVAVLHGMVDDYIYGGKGTILAFALIGMASGVYTNGYTETGLEDQPVLMKQVLSRRNVYYISLILSIFSVVFFLNNYNKLRSAWYANLGAVEMARIELAGFPTNKWTESSILSDLAPAEASLHSSLQFDPVNRVANQRLGMISMLRRDFDTAATYLEIAHIQAPSHRGIIKSLGYCYVWLGDMKKALPLLLQIHEAKEELDVYSWWWTVQGRSDLSKNASTALDILEADSSQP